MADQDCFWKAVQYAEATGASIATILSALGFPPFWIAAAIGGLGGLAGWYGWQSCSSEQFDALMAKYCAENGGCNFGRHGH
ncbi:hypothetical protein GJAV_G00001850 [Gymnothorax javanicus]|nr:hypothetical protein GJAV_G00001850 [Gymnothorax javanicus]